MRMSSGPQRTALGKPDASTRPTAHLSAGDQRSGGPSAVLAQSNSRTRRAISPPVSAASSPNARAGAPGAGAAASTAGTTIGGEDAGDFRIGSIRFYNELTPALVPAPPRRPAAKAGYYDEV